jgi:Immunity protein Imm1
MTVQGTIQWGQDDVAAVDSADAFDDLLARLEARARHQPIMIDVIASDGRSLVLGLGRSKTVLSLAGPDGSPPYFVSVGDEDAEGDISFEYHGETTDFRLRYAVPIQVARAAAAQFLSERGLPDAVRWEEI